MCEQARQRKIRSDECVCMYLIEYVNCVKTCEERSQSIELESYMHAAHKLNFGHKA